MAEKLCVSRGSGVMNLAYITRDIIHISGRDRMKIIESIGLVGVVLTVSASSASITELGAGQSVAVDGVRILDDFSLIGSGPSFFTPFTVMGDGGWGDFV